MGSDHEVPGLAQRYVEEWLHRYNDTAHSLSNVRTSIKFVVLEWRLRTINTAFKVVVAI